MPYQGFHELFPERAKAETRSIILEGEQKANCPLPAGTYSFLEMFCNERGCDCRRVMFYVLFDQDGQGHLEAVIAWGWENRSFYKKWFRENDPEMLALLKGPILNLGSPQSKLAPALLNLVREVLLQDPAYIERVKSHYWAFRNKIEGRNIVEIKHRRGRVKKKHGRRV
ncbi:hypothetical protein ACFL3F_00590 [Planctomycetota bacterium]